MQTPFVDTAGSPTLATIPEQELELKLPATPPGPPGQGTSPNTSPVSLDEEFSEDDRLRYLGRMVSAVSHELNNRLSSVLGFAELLALKDTPPEAQRLVSKLRTYTESLRSLADGLSGFSQAASKGPHPCDPTPLIRQAVDLACCEAKVAGIKLQCELPQQLPAVELTGPRFRLGLFIVLDAMICGLSGTGALQAPGRIIRLDGALDGSRQLTLYLTAATESAPAWKGEEPPPLEGVERGQRVLNAQGILAGWQRAADGHWQYRLSFAA